MMKVIKLKNTLGQLMETVYAENAELARPFFRKTLWHCPQAAPPWPVPALTSAALF